MKTFRPARKRTAAPLPFPTVGDRSRGAHARRERKATRDLPNHDAPAKVACRVSPVLVGSSAQGFKADLYPCGRDHLSVWGLHNARKIAVEDCDVWLAPPEYVILRKLEYYREGGSEKHLRDIEGILATSGDSVNADEIEKRAQSLGVRAEWDALCARWKSG